MTAVLRSPTQSPVLAVSSSRASNSSCSHMHNASVPMRHIRFAPLPEPTAQVDNSNPIMDSHSRTLSSLSSDIVDVQRNASSKSKPKSSLSRQFNLFKRSSTDSTAHDPQPYDFGAPLSRSASIPIPSNDKQPRHFSTAPSTNSLCSGGDHHAMPQNQFPRTSSPEPVPAPSHPPPLQRAQKSPQVACTCSTDASTVQSADHSQTSLQTCAMNPSLWNGGTAAWAASAAAAIQSIPPSPREPLPYFQTVTPRRSVMVLGKGKIVRVYLI